MYQFTFQDPFAEKYFKENVIDTSRVSTEVCKKKKLPYIDERGFIRNTKAFMEVNLFYKKNGHYPIFPRNSKDYNDFWVTREKRDRCTNGLWLGQVRITKYFYFFLNYHALITTEEGDNEEGFDGVEEEHNLPSWWLIHFNFFHLFEYASKTGQDLCLIKPRGCGLTEAAVSATRCDYHVPTVDKKGKPKFRSHQVYASHKNYLKGKGKFADLTHEAITWLNSFGNKTGMNKPAGVKQRIGDEMILIPGHITGDGKGTAVQTGGSIETTILNQPDKAVGGRKSNFWFEECQHEDDQVLTYNKGFTPLKKLKKGDVLKGVDGKKRKVNKVSKGETQLYDVLLCPEDVADAHWEPAIRVTDFHRHYIVRATDNHNQKEYAYYELSLRELCQYFAEDFIKSCRMVKLCPETNTLVKYKFKFAKRTKEKEPYVSISIDKDKLYITNGNLVTHNSGTYENLGKILQKIYPNTLRRGKKAGTIVIWGTSNADPKGIESFKNILLSPFTYNCMGFKDVWKDVKTPEEAAQVPIYPFEYVMPKDTAESCVGWFIPYYEHNKLDADGNPDREAAYTWVQEERIRKLRHASTDTHKDDVITFIADHPVTLQEALMVSHGRYFGSDQLTTQVVNLETKIIEPTIYRGNFDWVKNDKDEIVEIRFIPDKQGKHLITEHPPWAEYNGSYYSVNLRERHLLTDFLYVAGIDSIDQGTTDSSTAGSDAACLIKKRMSNMNAVSDPFANSYVCMYSNRGATARDDYRNITQNLLYFNAIALLEYTKIGIMNYIVHELKLPHLLAFQPKSPHRVITNYKARPTQRGMTVSSASIKHGLSLIKEYIDDHYSRLLLYPLVDQLSRFTYDKKGKFDLVAAMMMCEFQDTEMMDVLARTKETKRDNKIGFPVWQTINGKRVCKAIARDD